MGRIFRTLDGVEIREDLLPHWGRDLAVMLFDAAESIDAGVDVDALDGLSFSPGIENAIRRRRHSMCEIFESPLMLFAADLDRRRMHHAGESDERPQGPIEHGIVRDRRPGCPPSTREIDLLSDVFMMMGLDIGVADGKLLVNGVPHRFPDSCLLAFAQRVFGSVSIDRLTPIALLAHVLSEQGQCRRASRGDESVLVIDTPPIAAAGRLLAVAFKLHDRPIFLDRSRKETAPISVPFDVLNDHWRITGSHWLNPTSKRGEFLFPVRSLGDVAGDVRRELLSSGQREIVATEFAEFLRALAEHRMLGGISISKELLDGTSTNHLPSVLQHMVEAQTGVMVTPVDISDLPDFVPQSCLLVNTTDARMFTVDEFSSQFDWELVGILPRTTWKKEPALLFLDRVILNQLRSIGIVSPFERLSRKALEHAFQRWWAQWNKVPAVLPPEFWVFPGGPSKEAIASVLETSEEKDLLQLEKGFDALEGGSIDDFTTVIARRSDFLRPVVCDPIRLDKRRRLWHEIEQCRVNSKKDDAVVQHLLERLHKLAPCETAACLAQLILPLDRRLGKDHIDHWDEQEVGCACRIALDSCWGTSLDLNAGIVEKRALRL